MLFANVAHQRSISSPVVSNNDVAKQLKKLKLLKARVQMIFFSFFFFERRGILNHTDLRRYFNKSIHS